MAAKISLPHSAIAAESPRQYYGAVPVGVPTHATGWPFVMGGVVTM
jgi:hypothetical protein